MIKVVRLDQDVNDLWSRQDKLRNIAGVLWFDSYELALAGLTPPSAHASTHAAAGSDPITISESQVTNLISDLSAKIAKAIGTAKGDLIGFTASATPTNVAIGTDGWVLVADSASPAGFKWTAISGSGLVDADYGDIIVSGGATVFTIDNDVVTYAKMQNVSATSRLLGRTTAGAGDVEEVVLDPDGTLAAASDIIVATQKAVKTFATGMAAAALASAQAYADGVAATAEGNANAYTDAEAASALAAAKLYADGVSATAEANAEAYADGKVLDSIADADTTHAPSRNAVFDALALKAPLASPALTGNPTAPTQSAGDNSTKIASTAYVDSAIVAGAVPDASETVKGKAEIATDAETQTGTDDLRIVTPLKLANWWTYVKTLVQTFSEVITFSKEIILSNITEALPMPNKLYSVGGALKWAGSFIAKAATDITATVTGANLFTIPDPSAIRFIRINADNTISVLDAATFLTAIGGQASGSYLVASNNLSDVVNAATARVNLGANTIGSNLFTATNPSAVTFIRVNADNTVTFRTAAQTLSDIGAQAAGTYLVAGNNLSDVTTPATARTNLGATTVGANIFTVTNPSAITFLRINADNSVTLRTAAQMITDLGGFGSGAGTFCQGNDSRLTDARTPTAHETTHLANGSDALPWTTIIGQGVAGSRPAAASSNAGYLYYATDTSVLSRSNGSSWDTISMSAAAHNLLSATHGDTLAGTVVRGDIVIGNSTPKWSKLAIGSAGKYLRTDGSDPSWAAIADGDITLSDVATNNASTSNHGFLPKLPSTDAASKFLNGGGSFVVITQDQVYQVTSDQNSTSTSFANITELGGIPTVAGATYMIDAYLLVNTSINTVGINCTVNHSTAVTSIRMAHKYPNSATTFLWEQFTALQGGTLNTAASGATVVEYILKGSVVINTAGNLAIQFKSETGGQVTVKAGSILKLTRIS